MKQLYKFVQISLSFLGKRKVLEIYLEVDLSIVHLERIYIILFHLNKEKRCDPDKKMKNCEISER